MIKYIDGRSQQCEVSDVMKSVNNHIRLLSKEKLSSEEIYSIMFREYEKCYDMVESLNQGYAITPYNPIPFQGRKGKIKEIIKRIIRKCIVWYTTDICNQQTNVNSTMTLWMNHQLYIMQCLLDENKRLNEKVNKITDNMEGKEE